MHAMDMALGAWEVAPILVEAYSWAAGAARRIGSTLLGARALLSKGTPRIRLATWQCPACGAFWLAKGPEDEHPCACTAEPLYTCLTGR